MIQSRLCGVRVTAGLCARLLAVLVAGALSTAQAQSYPARPVRLIVPFTVGQGSDILARAMAEKLTKMWNQTVIVENRAGANGAIALETVAKSAADGLTLLFTSNSPLVINPNLYKKLPYNVERDFKPVIMLATADILFVTNLQFPATTLSEVVAHLRANPHKYSYGSPGTGSTSNLAMEVFKKVMGVDLVHVPYKGSAPAMTDLIGGSIQIMLDAIPSAMPHVKSGRIRAIAMGGSKRSALAPGIPAAAESGVNDVPAGGWYGVLVPTGTDPAIITKLYEDLRTVITMPDISQRAQDQGMDSRETFNPARFTEFLKSETAYWEKMTHSLGMYQAE